MDSIEEAFARTKTITFDCYGTLIDWRAGVESSLLEIFHGAIIHRMHDVFDAYVKSEAQLEALPYQPYRQLLSAVVGALAKTFDAPVSAERRELLAERLPLWKPFADTNEALVRLKKRFRLGILSNIDRDLFERTAAQFDVTFDFVITAEDVHSYKPAHGHFERLLETHAQRDAVLHVAQSSFHDGVPAASLDLAYVWINRYNDVNDTTAKPLAEYPDLKSLADATCG